MKEKDKDKEIFNPKIYDENNINKKKEIVFHNQPELPPDITPELIMAFVHGGVRP